MRHLVIGTEAIVLIYNDPAKAWMPYGCARGGSIDLVTDFIETSITGQGTFKTFLPTSDSFTGTIDGLHNLNTPGLLSIADLQTRQIAHEDLIIRFDYQNENGDAYVLQGHFFITGSRINHSFDNVSTFNVDLKGTGILTQSYDSTPIINGIVIEVDFILPGGQNSIVVPDLIGLTDILLVSLDGSNFSPIILSGTPVDKQVKFTSSTGLLTFPNIQPEDRVGFVLYQILFEESS